VSQLKAAFDTDVILSGGMSMKRYYFRWFDPLHSEEKVTRFIADDFGEAMKFIQQDIKEINQAHSFHLKVSDFVFLKEEEESRPWARKGVDIQW
jgi:hypothetical protein